MARFARCVVRRRCEAARYRAAGPEVAAGGTFLARQRGVREDLKSAVRSVLRARTPTAVLLVTLGLGTGANAAVFSVVHSLLFRAPEGIAEPHLLATIHTSQFDGTPFGPSSMADYLSVRSAARSFENVAAFDDRTTTNARVGDLVQMTRVAIVGTDFFSVLGMSAYSGRLLDRRDFGPSASGAVISYALWEAAGRPSMDSLTVTVLGTPRNVVGIAPARFRGLESGRAIDVWIPMSVTSNDNHGDRYLTLVGRVRRHVALGDVNRELAVLSGKLASDFPATNRGMRGRPDDP